MQGPSSYLYPVPLVQIVGTSTDGSNGLFVYSSATPTLGALIASITAVQGTDAEGNAYLGGIVSYSALGVYTQIDGGNFQTGVLNAAGEPANIGPNDTAHNGTLIISTGLAVLGGDVAAIIMRDTNGGQRTGQVLINVGAGGSQTTSLLEVQGDATIFGPFQVGLSTSPQNSLFEGDVTVSGTTYLSNLNVYGAMIMESGSTFTDSDTWHQITTGFPSGWTGTVYYTLTFDGDIKCMLDLTIASGTTLTKNSTDVFTLPSGYTPNLDHWMTLPLADLAQEPWQLFTSGVFQFQGTTVTLSSTYHLMSEFRVSQTIA